MPLGVNLYDEERLQGRNVANANAVNIVSPGIVEDGLVLQLDAGNFNSYPISGTTWYDLSGFNNNGTLVNGPTYSSAGSGSLLFDGTNDYVTFNDSQLLPTAGLTVSCWLKTATADKWIFDKANGAPGGNFSLGWALEVTSASKLEFAVSGKIIATTGNVTTNVFINAVGVWIPSTSVTIYLDGAQSITNGTSVPATLANPSSTLRLGGRTGNLDYWNGNIAIPLIYNRALTPTEVAQNFNATRARFGI